MNHQLFNKHSDYQHTCRASAVDAHILSKAPFKSIKEQKGDKTVVPFIGEGYYFWEANLDGAKRWGKKRYGEKKYRILEVKNWDIHTDDLIDLTNRNHLKYFKELQELVLATNQNATNYCVGTWIEIFKKMNQKDGKIFPFKLIKSEENFTFNKLKTESIDQEKISYSSSGYFMYLNPIYILCCLDKVIIPADRCIISE